MINTSPGYTLIKLTSAVILSVLLLCSGFILTRCARPGTPAGGPKDELPPEVLSEIPPNRTVFFNTNKATITFNEFIQLKDPSKEIFISPPIRTRPEFKAIGKKISIEFQEELKPNSTYTINFGSSIIDFTEGNPLVNYEYVFATGGYIDSLSIPGIVLNAFDRKPVESVIVMVYMDDNDTVSLDSLPYIVPPKSASKTTKDGLFRINNLSAGEYKIFALEDLNNNFIFDLPNERIAFLDSLIIIEPELTVIDSVETADSTDVAVNTETADSTGAAELALRVLTEDKYTLYLFEEIDSTQKLLSKKLVGRSLLQYIFRMPADSVTITPVGFQPEIPDWYITEFSMTKDTVNFWLKSGLPDTIRICMSTGDSLVDTSRYIISKTATERPGRKKESAATILNIISSAVAGAFDLNKNFNLYFAKPIEEYYPGRIHLFTLTDTIIPVFSFQGTLKKEGQIDYKWKPEEFYHLMIEDSAFCDLSGAYNDSTSFKFKVRAYEDYGILLMNVNLPEIPGQYIIQLMSDKETVLRQQFVPHTGLVRFDYLMPGNYKLKAIFDTNSNGKWDTGKYRYNSLPERVEYYTPGVSIRANWDLQEEWRID